MTNLKITNVKYFEEMGELLQKQVSESYPSLYVSDPVLEIEEGTVCVQADISIPGREDLFYIEWLYSLPGYEENENYVYECAIFTADGEELAVGYSSDFTKATIECGQNCQNLFQGVSNWLEMTFGRF
jgi:hypothetical protein